MTISPDDLREQPVSRAIAGLVRFIRARSFDYLTISGSPAGTPAANTLYAGYGRTNHIATVPLAGDGSKTIPLAPTAVTGRYIVLLRNLRPVTDDDDLAMRFNGASGASDYGWVNDIFQVNTVDGLGSVRNADYADSEMQFGNVSAGGGVGDAAGEGVSGVITIIPTDGVVYTKVTWELADTASNATLQGISGRGEYKSTSSLTSVTFLFLGSNLETGKITVLEEVAI